MNDTTKSTNERHDAATQELHAAIDVYRAACKAMAEAEQRLAKARDGYRRTTDEVMRGLPGQASPLTEGLVRSYEQQVQSTAESPVRPMGIGWPAALTTQGASHGR